MGADEEVAPGSRFRVGARGGPRMEGEVTWWAWRGGGVGLEIEDGGYGDFLCVVLFLKQ